MNETAGPFETLLPILALFVMLWVFWCILKGAVILFKRASKSGVGHVVLYFIGWIVITPIMMIWSFCVGVVA